MQTGQPAKAKPTRRRACALLSLSLALGLTLAVPESSQAGTAGPEAASLPVRAVWVDNGTLGRLEGRPGVARLMDQIREAGLNTVFVEALFRGYSLYPGPWQDPRFARWPEDPLQVVVDEARRAGLSVHAWMWALGAGILGRSGPLLQQHPEWANLDAAGNAFSATESAMPWLDPSRPEVRAFVAAEAAGLASRYGLDGIHLDYVRYSNELAGPFGFSAHSLQAFEEATGIRLAGRDPASLSAQEQEAWDLWREDQVTRLVAEVREALRSAAPKALLSAAVIPELTQARLLFLQDWRRWLADGLVDFVTVMAYTSSRANLEDVLAGVRADLEALAPWRPVEHLARRTVVGLALYAVTPDSLPGQLEAVRTHGFGGVALFSTSYLSLPVRRMLAGGPFATPSPLPDLAAGVVAAPLPRQARPRAAPPALPGGDGPDEVSQAALRPGAFPVNLARSARVQVDSSFRGYSPAPLTDGVRNDVSEVGRWAEVAWASAETPGPHWVELVWEQPVTVSRVDVYWALDRGRFLSSRRVRLEALTASGEWEVLWDIESAAPNHRIRRTSITFVPVSTTALRLVQPEGAGPLGRPNLMWIAEIEVY